MTDLKQLSLVEFLSLPVNQIAGWMQARRLTVGFPLDGTRRWYLLHHGGVFDYHGYQMVTAQRCVELFDLMFSHGAESILVPSFGGELLSRGKEYVQAILYALPFLARHPIFTDYYNRCQVEVHFYGDWRRQVQGLPGAEALVEAFDECQATYCTGKRRLFYGLWADDVMVSMADELNASRRENREVTRESLIERYYGAYVPPADVYIGFGRPAVFDIPMLIGPQTDLYYTVAPSFDLDERLFRHMLWDHYVGRWTQQEWDGLSAEDLTVLKAYYQAQHDQVLGLGAVDEATGVWYPQGGASIDAFRRS